MPRDTRQSIEPAGREDRNQFDSFAVPSRWFGFVFAVFAFPLAIAGAEVRRTTLLDSGWRTIAVETGAPLPAGVEAAGFDDHAWRVVEVPHNWDEYEGFRQVRHGDRHGTAWYRRTFTVGRSETGRKIFLFFEGVGSYATVWVNGHLVGGHAGGLTTFTLDVTTAVYLGADNLLVLRADHPAGIRDLPWVCGGCELAAGFSEGTQPFGIFRPVHLITTAPVRVEPFGVHVWNDADATAASAQLHIETEVKNYGPNPAAFTLVTRILAPDEPEKRNHRVPPWRSTPTSNAVPPSGIPTSVGSGDPTLHPTQLVSEARTEVSLAPGASMIIQQRPPLITSASLWSPDSPSLYTVVSGISIEGSVTDETSTPFGIRTIHWPAPGDADGRLLINGRPYFLNGICDYEHNLGASHAFTAEQVRARVREIESAGFNAFRDAHEPHNLRFQSYWDRDGLLWWPQFGAHIWFDNPAFRANFMTLLRDWVRERRNSPSLVLWGLQNESVLPTKFAEECSALIRELDPTTSTQRKITTCNGGTGTDWNIPQNWSGTYGGDPLTYANDLRRDHLVGEYGAWRSLGLHSEGGFQSKGPLSEDRMTALLETKVRLAESVRNEAAGEFLWSFTTHSNPGRNVGEQGEQQDDGIRPLDHISPANNKGLFTIWGEPTDAYQMYRSNYAADAIPALAVETLTRRNADTLTSGQSPEEGTGNADDNHQRSVASTIVGGVSQPRNSAAAGDATSSSRHGSAASVSPSQRVGISALHGRSVAAPMVYIVSHTWPDRWTTPGRKSGIIVYSNCDEVELFNDLGERSLGRRTRHGIGTHFEWDDVEIATNVLYAEGRVGGEVVATDLITLHHLPAAPRFAAAQAAEPDLVSPQPGQNYLYRVNCGGPDYIDHDGHLWFADRDLTPQETTAATHSLRVPVLESPVRDPGSNSDSENRSSSDWGSISWAAEWPNLPPRFGSQRKTYDGIIGTRDPALFQTFRYGRDQLRYVFPVPNGDYQVELYFVEPWYGDPPDWRHPSSAGGLTSPRNIHSASVGGAPRDTHLAPVGGATSLRDSKSPENPRAGVITLTGDGGNPLVEVIQRAQVSEQIAPPTAGWRLFDVAVNGRTAFENLDLAREAGRDVALKKVVAAHVTEGRIELSFPRVAAGQAVISAIAISTANAAVRPPPLPDGLITDLRVGDIAHATDCKVEHTLDTGDQTYGDAAGGFTSLPPELLGADWIRTASGSRTAMSDDLVRFAVSADADVYVAADSDAKSSWLSGWEETGEVVRTNAAPNVKFALFRHAFNRGSAVTLGPANPGTAMYCIFAVPRRPAPPAQLVREVAAVDTGQPNPSAFGWRASGSLRSGREIYIDTAVRVVTLPAPLSDCDLLSPPHTGAPPVAFTVADYVEVYVAFDARIAVRPDWLADWIDAHETITATDGLKFSLLRHRYNPGDLIQLGGPVPRVTDSGATVAAMYFAIIRAVRPAVLLEAEAAALMAARPITGIAGATGTGAVELEPGADHAITWTVPIGVGDRYGLDFRYSAAKPAPATRGELAIIDADGRILRTDHLEFPSVKSPGAWTFLRTRTGSSLNAGTYHFRLTLKGPSPLVFDSLEVE